MKNVLIISALVFFTGCAGQKGEDSVRDKNVSRPVQSIDSAVLERCLAECDYLDIIFYELPISVSQDELSSIRNTLQFYSRQTAIPKEECHSIGRLSYMINGDIFLEAEIYFSPECLYFGFVENNVPKYYHAMTPQALNFFRNIIGQSRPPGE